jgi:hypothetical protein
VLTASRKGVRQVVAASPVAEASGEENAQPEKPGVAHESSTWMSNLAPEHVPARDQRQRNSGASVFRLAGARNVPV